MPAIRAPMGERFIQRSPRPLWTPLENSESADGPHVSGLHPRPEAAPAGAGGPPDGGMLNSLTIWRSLRAIFFVSLMYMTATNLVAV